MNRYKIIAAVTNDLSQDQRMHRICHSLSSAGYDVTLVGRSLSHSMALPNYSFSCKRIKCLFNKGFLFYAEYNIRLLFYLLSNSFDVVNAVDTDTIMAAVIAARIKNGLLTVDFHELFSQVPELKDSPRKKGVWEKLESIFIKRADLIYTVNESLSSIFRTKYKLDVHAIYNYPVKKGSILEKQLSIPIKILYQGKINEGRGIKELIEAIKLIENVELHIIGDGDLFEHAKTWITGFQEKIILHGFIPPESLNVITTKYDIGINLLVRNSMSYFYSSANKFFDYIMAGMPVISMSYPEYKVVNENYNVAVLVDDLNKDSIIKAIKDTIENYSTLHDNCSIAREVLHWQSQEIRLLQLYSKLLKEN